ncbi:MAG: formylglycine-generating enzyme family protein [Akkermansiaceae bacterium]|nr:formylglycine-generating enzyme family protein [Akkermansiaceae bacterium]
MPSEAEWEKAARGGLAGQRFPWGDPITQNLANYYSSTASYLYDLGPNGFNPIGSVRGTSPAPGEESGTKPREPRCPGAGGGPVGSGSIRGRGPAGLPIRSPPRWHGFGVFQGRCRNWRRSPPGCRSGGSDA